MSRKRRKQRQVNAVPRIQLSARKKVMFVVAAMTIFFVMLEVLLAASGIQPISAMDDPLAGFSSRIPLFVEVKEPNGELYLTTAKNKRKWFNEQRFPKVKAPHTYRVFCLGGSTTYGHPYDDPTSFCGWLREFLPVADAGRKWELINAGGISYASYRVAMLMEELNQYQPDLYIIYAGHNEFLEEQTYADIKQVPAMVRSVGGVLSYTRTYAAIRKLLPQPAAPDPSKDLLSHEVKPVLDDGVGPDAFVRNEPRLQQVKTLYRRNLEHMLDLAQAAGAKVIVVKSASNLRDCAPFKSQFSEAVTPANREKIQDLLRQADQERSQGKGEEALASVDQALHLDDHYARSHFLRGKALDHLGRIEEAKLAYQRARDEDICPLRDRTDMEAIVEDVARERNVGFVDFVQIVAGLARDGIPGEDWFLDHVHPTIAGNRTLALALIDELVAQQWLQTGSEWNQAAIDRVTATVEGRIDQQAHGIALRNLAKVLSWAGKRDEAERLALRASKVVVQDADTYYIAGNALMSQGKMAEALEQYEKALQLDPNSLLVRNSLGVAYQKLGRFDDAIAQYEKALQIRPDFAPAHSNLGALYQRKGDLTQAVLHFKKAVEARPEYTKGRNNLGVLYLRQGNLAAAATEFEQVLKVDPEFAEAQFNLGRVQLAQGALDEGTQHLEQAIRIKPDYAPAHHRLGTLRQQQGNLPGALEHFRRAVQLTGESQAEYLAALASACAADQNWIEAVQWQSRAVDVASPSEKGMYLRQLDAWRNNRK